MAVKKITEEYFEDVKRSLKNKWRWTRYTNRHLHEIAGLHGISHKTVVQIKASENYEQYMEQVKAQHPPFAKYSLREDLFQLHEELLGNKVKYTKPKTGSQAIAQIRYELVTKAKHA